MTGTDNKEKQSVSTQHATWRPLAIALSVLLLGSVAFGLRSMVGQLQAAGRSVSSADAENQEEAFAEKNKGMRLKIQQRRSEFDAMVGRMLPVPAGSFQMGADAEENNERPIHRVEIRAFEIDEAEVTVASWQKCMSQGKCESPAAEGQCNFARPERRRHPVNCVNFTQAKGFCEWAVKRLPTEEEWEYLARGSDDRSYVWGNTEPLDQLCWRKGDKPDAGTCLSTDFEAGNSLLGVKDLGGNLSEWTASAYCPYSRKNCEVSSKSIRGASWAETEPSNVRVTHRAHANIDHQSPTIGFRCARDLI